MKFLLTAVMCFALVLPAIAEEAKQMQNEEAVIILFDTDKAELSEEGVGTLEKIAKKATANNKVRIIVLGHADKRGDRLYNLDLGDKRAKSVETKLEELGVDSYQIYAASYGEEKPAAPHDEISEHLALNRRAEIIALEVPRPEYRKNTLRLYLGAGPFDLDRKDFIDRVELDQSYNFVGGLGYSRAINEKWNLGVTGMSNLSFFLNLGYNF
jgi:hypothetical protein